MRILLDESLPRRLQRLLEGHDVRTVQEQGWQAKENGDLLALASREFDLFVTPDQNLPHQQNLAKFDLAVVVLVAESNRLASYEPLAEQLRKAVERTKPGEARRVAA